EHFERVAVLADDFEVGAIGAAWNSRHVPRWIRFVEICFPAGKVLSIEERPPGIVCGRNDVGEKQSDKDEERMAHVRKLMNSMRSSKLNSGMAYTYVCQSHSRSAAESRVSNEACQRRPQCGIGVVKRS